MSGVSFHDVAMASLCTGAAIATVPFVATCLIASSKIIVVSVIVNIFVRILTAGTVWVDLPVDFVHVPLLWKVSLVTGAVGGTIVAISLLMLSIDYLYHKGWRTGRSFF